MTETLTNTQNDRAEIADLVSRVGMTFDDQDADGLRECWHVDGVQIINDPTGARHEIPGRDAVLGAAAGVWSAGPSKTRHFVATPVIDLDASGQRASVRHYSIYPVVGPESKKPGFGEYRVEVAKDAEDGRWRVTLQEITLHSVGEID